MRPGIEVVKASTWEAPFYSRIAAARALELSVLYSVTLLQVGRGNERSLFALRPRLSDPFTSCSMPR
jgi:hypothetical protein